MNIVESRSNIEFVTVLLLDNRCLSFLELPEFIFFPLLFLVFDRWSYVVLTDAGDGHFLLNQFAEAVLAKHYFVIFEFC